MFIYILSSGVNIVFQRVVLIQGELLLYKSALARKGTSFIQIKKIKLV
jgi:hypothetical protein